MRPELITNEYGFITDYLSEFFREMRKRTFSDALDKYFKLGNNLNQRDVIAVRKTVSGLIKLIYPNGEYSKEDLVEIAEIMLNRLLLKFKTAGRKMTLFRKILNNAKQLPYPGELKNLLKTSLAFSDPNSEYDYLKRIYNTLEKSDDDNLKNIQEKGFTMREIEILTGVSKSQVSRRIKEMI